GKQCEKCGGFWFPALGDDHHCPSEDDKSEAIARLVDKLKLHESQETTISRLQESLTASESKVAALEEENASLRDQVSALDEGAAALEAEVGRMRHSLDHINKVLSPGIRTFDELLRDMGWASDEA